MSRKTYRFGLVLFVSGALGASLLGCGEGETTPSTESQQAAGEGSGDPAEQVPSSEPDGEAEVIAATLAKLPPDDRAAAERQEICPVSGEPLGSMGVPPKITVDGREVFVCCAGCKDAVQEDPEKYLANIPADVSEDQTSGE